ncbi:MAG: 50S ribosomal protein L13 [Candidatus Helarchaeota archaeon]
MTQYTVIDANDLILGRMASIVAKRLLLGEKIAIVNAEKAVISGKYSQIIKSRKEKLKIRSLRNPRRGPFHPRRPDRIVRRTIRGMLPWKKPRGKKAFHNLRVYIGVPDQFQSDKIKFETIKEASVSRLKETFIRVGDLAIQLGGNYE